MGNQMLLGRQPCPAPRAPVLSTTVGTAEGLTVHTRAVELNVIVETRLLHATRATTSYLQLDEQ